MKNNDLSSRGFRDTFDYAVHEAELVEDSEATSPWWWDGLDAIESAFFCMLVGIRRFVMEQFPDWLLSVAKVAGRIIHKGLRALAYGLAWIAISFGPIGFLWLVPWWFPRSVVVSVVVVWVGFALAGSIWGLFYVKRRNGSRHRVND
jgi:hypothetical protein